MNEELQTVNAEQMAKMDELARTNNDMKNLLNSTEIITVFLDGELRVRRFTTGANRLFKLIPGDVGRPLTDIATDLIYPDLPDDIREVLRTLAFSEKTIATTDGRSFAVRIMPYRTLENRIDGVVITFTDITKAKNLEAELRETAGILRAVVQASPAIIICLSQEGRVLEFNPEAERQLGRSRDEVLGQDFVKLFVPKQEQSRTAEVMQKMLAASPETVPVMRVKGSDGAEISLQWSARKILDANGTASSVIAVGQDVTAKSGTRT